MPALAGRRVVVTRAAEQADALADLLRAEGAEAVVVPLTAIVPEAAAVAALAALAPDDFDWLAVTSPNAAAAYTAVHAGTPASVAAVGTATAAALVASGHPPTLVPARQRAEGLVAEFPAGSGRVLVVQAVEGETVLADGLAAKGWDVTVVRPYRSAPRTPTAAQRSAVLAAEAVLFASGSAARAWVAAFGPSAPSIVVAIGPQTAAAVTAAGLKVTAIAADHSLSGLVDALVQCVTGRP